MAPKPSNLSKGHKVNEISRNEDKPSAKNNGSENFEWRVTLDEGGVRVLEPYGDSAEANTENWKEGRDMGKKIVEDWLKK